jgi:hypothetical protein
VSYEGPVRKSGELERVLALPRRVLNFEAPEVVALARTWSEQLLNDAGKREFARVVALPLEQQAAEFARFARPRDQGGEGCPILMRPEQAVMLYEAYHCKGLFASAAVGVGKTLVSWLLSLILGAQRPVVLVPASVEAKTHDDFRDLSRFWQSPRPTPQVITYEKLGNPQHAAMLCDCARCTNATHEPAVPGGLRPDLLIPDEAHRLRNPDAAVTRRVGRYMARHPETIYACMTGTPWRKSLRNSAPQIIWALKWGAPLPLTYVDMQEWCEALDFSSREAPRDPGALTWLEGIDPKEVETYEERLEIAARGFQKRMLSTPGFFQTDKQSSDQPIYIRFLQAPDDPILDEAFHHFRKTATTLDGWDVDDAFSSLRHGTEMGCGFYYAWDPRPPKYWLDARRAAYKFVQEQLGTSLGRGHAPLDSSARVYRAFPNDPILQDWKAKEPTFIPNTVARPITASVLGYATAWIKANGPALIWVQHDYVGNALSAMSGVPYFASKGLDAAGRDIRKYSAKESAIVSLRSNSVGKNLQGWNKTLVVGPPQAATDWEQGVLGRTHRQGQLNPVHVDVILACAENLHAVNMAYEEQWWVRSRGGAVGKLLIANYDWSHFPAEKLGSLPLGHPSRPRWVRPGAMTNSVARV